MLLFLSAITFTFVSCSFDVSEYNATDNVVSQITTILHILQRIDSKVTVICDSQLDKMCENVLRLLSTSMKVSIFNTNTTVLFSTLNCLCFYSYRSLHSFVRTQNWLSDAYYILLIVDELEIHRILPMFWNSNGVRRTLLFPVFKTQLYSTTNTGEVKVLYLEKVQNEKDLFDVKNFGGQSLRVRMFYRFPEVFKIPSGEVMGWNYKMMELTAKYLNFVPIILDNTEKTDLFGDYINGTYTGGMGDIAYGRSNIAMNSYLPQMIPDKKLKYTWPSNLEYICIMVPKAGRIPKYLALFTCFSLLTWINIIGTAVIVCCARYAMSYLGWKKVNYNKASNGNIILTTILATLSISLPMSQYKYLPNRLILIVYLFSMNIVVVTFQASLVTLLSIPKYHEDINTLEELKVSGMKIQVDSVALVNILKEDLLLSKLGDQYQLVVDDSYNYENAIMGRFPSDVVNLFKDFTEIIRNHSFERHKLPECPLQYYTSYIIPQNFPFERELNLFIMRTVENGFFVKWGNDVINYNLNNKSSALLKVFQNKELKTNNKTFSLEDVEIAFFILIFGLTASMMTFAGELWYNRKKSFTVNRTLMQSGYY